MTNTHETDETNEHQFLLEDLARAQKRTMNAKYLEAQKEFSTEAYPLMITIAEHFGERLQALEAAMDEMIQQTDSFLQPELAQQLTATLDLAKLLAEGVLALANGNPAAGMALKPLLGHATAYLTAYEMTSEAIEEATVPPGADEDKDEDDTDEDEEEEESAAVEGSTL